MVSANDKVIVEMHLSGGNCHDAPQGRVSIEHIGDSYSGVPILMDRAYEGDKTRELCQSFGHKPIVPPKKNRINPWKYDAVEIVSTGSSINICAKLCNRTIEWER